MQSAPMSSLICTIPLHACSILRVCCDHPCYKQLTFCLWLQLYSRAGQEAEGEVRKATKPAAIKHTVRLAGFGAATKLNGQGVALYPSSDRSAPT